MKNLKSQPKADWSLTKKIKKSVQKMLASFLLVTTVMWSLGASLMNVAPVVKAAGGINVMYVNDAGATQDTFLDDLISQKAFLEINIFEETGGTLNSVSVCLDEMNGFNPTDDLEALTLWQDDSDGTFEPGSGDTLLSTVTSYTTLTDSYAMGGTCPQATFSSLGLSIPASTSQIRLFVAAQAKANLNETPIHSFNPIIPIGGIDVTVGSNAAIMDWPSGMNSMFPPVFLGTEGTGMMGSPLLISEVMVGTGSSANDEFIELYNRSPQAIAMDAFKLHIKDASGTNGYKTLTLTNTCDTDGVHVGTSDQPCDHIAANSFYLIAPTGSSRVPDATYATSGNLLIPNGAVYISNSETENTDVMDLVGWGTQPTDGYESQAATGLIDDGKALERKAFPDSTASKMAVGGIHEDKGNCEDIHNNAMDFVVIATPVPQNTNSSSESSGGDYDPNSGSSVLINEVFYNTATEQGWIELYNRSDGIADIASWKLTSGGNTYDIPSLTSTTEMPSGGFITVYWNAIGVNDTTATSSSSLYTTTSGFTDLGIYGGDIILTLSDGTSVKDYVQYGGSGFAKESDANAVGEWMLGDYVMNCLYGESIGRRSINGEDFNGSGDWQTYSSASPGFSNMGGDSTAPTAVTSVTLIDNDNSVYGIDGNDITMTWVPATAPDPSFDRYEIYLLPTTTAFDGDAHSPIDYIYGGQYYNGNSSLTYEYTGGGFINANSAGTSLSATSYIAYVMAVDFAGNRSSVAVSSAYSLSSASDNTAAGVDEQNPFIMHMPVWQAKATANIVLLARFQDDRELGTVPGVGAQVVWKAGTSASLPDLSVSPTATNCVVVEAGFYSCTIPWGSWDANSVIGYYLRAEDAASTPNKSFVASAWDENLTEENAIASPIMIDILAADGDVAGDYTDGDSDADLSGFVYASDGSPINGAKVFIEGTAIGHVASDATGAFTIPDNTMYSGSFGVIAFEDNYMDMFINAFKGESVSFYLNQGDMNMMGGMDMPFVTWTAPGEGMMGAPTDIYCTGDCSTSTTAGEMPVLIGFSKPMNANTINDLDASNAGSNIYLTTNGNDRVIGKVYYDSIMNEARFYTSTHNVLQPDTFYNIVATQGVTDEDGNPIGGNNPDGSYSSGFVTMGDNTDFWSGDDYTDYGAGGMMMPPYVQGTTPNPGAYNVPPNSSIMVEFSESMDSSSISDSSIKLYPISSESNWTLGNAITATVSLDQTTQRVATLVPGSSLPANASNNGWYVLKVMGSVKSTAGIWFGDPSICGTVSPDTCLLTSSSYETSFQVSTVVDATPPTVIGSYPNNNDGITSSVSAVDVGIAGIEIGFSEAMNSTTITAQNITLASGSSSVTGTVKYDPMNNMAKFIPSSAFNANTQYTLTISTSVTDLAGVDIVATTISFKTGTADTTEPTLMYANGDDYMLAVTYSEPMNSAGQTNTSRWGTSVLNPANYFIQTVNSVGSPVNPYQSATVLSSDLNFSYDEMNNTVIIEGLNFFVSEPYPADFRIFIDSVTDRSNNIITNSANHLDITLSNAAQGPIQNSTDTYGMLGPGTYDPMMDMGDMGMMMAGAFPMNGMAGQTSMYFIDVPTMKAIPSGGTIMLTFPSGFDVSGAAEDLYSPINSDINEWNAGVITVDDVVGNQASRTVTITTGGGATQPNDFLHMDIKGIVNSSIPKDFGTEGYLVDIKTFSDSGALLESITTMPFFLSQGGNYTLSGTITFLKGDGSTPLDNNIDINEKINIFLGSPMTGPMEFEGTFTGSTKTIDYSFTGLPEGDYHFFTEPTITLNVAGVATEFGGMMMPEPIWLNEATDLTSTGDDDIIDKDLDITQLDSSSGAVITVTLTGDFSTNSTADRVDIFANSPSGFRVKTVTPNTDDATNADGEGEAGNQITQYTLYLPAGNWMIGIGPAMPMGPMAGPPPMPDWMPPMPTDIYSDGSNPGSASFSILNQESITVSGTVTDGTNGIANAEVYAYQPMGGFGGAFTKTATDGSFVLKVPVKGTYVIGAYKPGLPSGPEQSLNIQQNETGLSLILQMPSYTISGKVLNSNSQAVAYAPVWAYQPNGWGHADTMTDATGNYILYVDNGSWQIEADAPGIGWMQYDRLIAIDSVSQSDINLKPDTDTLWKTISGTITINDATQNYMPIRAVAYDASGNYLGREYSGMTDSSGVYSISVPGIASGSKYYRVDIWTPDFGEVGLSNDTVPNSPANITVGSSNVTSADITITSGNLNTTTVQFDNKEDYVGSEAFINIDGVDCTDMTGYYNCVPTGFHKSIRVSDISGTNPAVELTAGDYFFFVDVPGTGHFIPKSTSPAFDTSKGCIVIDGDNEEVQFALPDLDSADAIITVSGTISGPATDQMDAWVWIGNPETGFHSGGQAAVSDGTYSMKVPKLSSGNYFVGADKQGFLSGEPTSIAGTEATYTIDITLSAQANTISGKLYADANSNNSYNTGEEIPNGWVHAENISTGAHTHAPVDGSGAFSLGVTDGTWKMFGMANGYSESQYCENALPAVLTVSGSDLANKNIGLNVDANWINMTKSSPMTPASGGVIDDTAQNTATGKASGTGVKLTVPPNALGSSTSSGTIATTETAAVSATNSMKPFDSKGKNITATDNSGQPITNLDNYIDMEMIIYRADVIANAEMNDLTKLKTLKIGYWDDTLSEWVNLSTIKTAYYKTNSDSEWTVYNGTTDQSGFDKFIDDALGTSPTFTSYVDYKLVFTASTNHLTVFAIGTSPDGLAPAAPTGLAQSSGSGTANAIEWNTVSTNSDTSAITDLHGYAVYRSDDGVTYSQISASAILAGVTTYTDSTVASAFSSYYYKVTAGDDDNIESTYSAAVQMCPTTTVSNGTIDSACSVACNEGYNLSNNSCVIQNSGAPSSSGTVPSSTTGQAAATSSNGGTISKTNSDGTSAKIELEAGALSESATITITPKSRTSVTVFRPIPTDKVVVGNYIYNFTAVSGTTTVNTFNKAVKLTFTYTNQQAEGFSEENFRIHYWNEISHKWIVLEDNVIDTVNNTVTAMTTHFTYFTILGTQTGGETTTGETTGGETPSDIIDGDIIQCQSSSNPFAVYIVKIVGDTKYIRHIVSLEIFNYYEHLKWDNLKQVDSLNEYSLSGWARVNTGPNGTPGPTDKVYEINGDQSKHWINMTAEDFLSHGGSEPAIYSVNQGELDLYRTGVDVMSL